MLQLFICMLDNTLQNVIKGKDNFDEMAISIGIIWPMGPNIHDLQYNILWGWQRTTALKPGCLEIDHSTWFDFILSCTQQYLQ